MRIILYSLQESYKTAKKSTVTEYLAGSLWISEINHEG